MANQWQLPEDGIVDQVAVRAAVEGTDPDRVIRLTRTEQIIAATLLATRGATPAEIATRLHMNLRKVVEVLGCAQRAA